MPDKDKQELVEDTGVDTADTTDVEKDDLFDEIDLILADDDPEEEKDDSAGDDGAGADDDEVEADEKTSVKEKTPLNKTTIIIAGVAVVAVIAIAVGLFFGIKYLGSDNFGNAAKINKEAVTRKRLNAEMVRIELQQPGIFDTANNGIDKDMVRSQTLDELINQTLLIQKAKEEKVEATDEQIDEELQKIKDYYGENYDKTLKDYGYSELDLRHQLEYTILLNGLLEKLVPKDTVTDAAIRKYYDDNPDMFKEQAGKRASHILFNIDDKATAEEVLQQLKDGADFAELAAKYSKDPGSAANGGDLGWPSQPYVPEFQAALDKLEKGEMSDLVETEYGWHIIKVTDVRKESITEFDKVKDDIKAQLINQEKSTKYQELINTLREDAEIEILDPAVKKYRKSQEAEKPAQESTTTK